MASMQRLYYCDMTTTVFYFIVETKRVFSFKKAGKRPKQVHVSMVVGSQLLCCLCKEINFGTNICKPLLISGWNKETVIECLSYKAKVY